VTGIRWRQYGSVVTSPHVGRGRLRAARTATFGLVTMALASLAHVAGGETAPGPTLLMALALPVAAVSFWLTRKQRGATAIALTLGCTQWLLHQAFMGVSSMPATIATHADAHLHTLPSSAGMEKVTRIALLPGPAMTVAHILAAAGVAVLLAQGDRMLAVLVAVVDLLVRPRASLVTATRVVWTRASVVGSQWNPLPWSVVLATGRRGPP
jgi:hypothetical protein